MNIFTVGYKSKMSAQMTTGLPFTSDLYDSSTETYKKYEEAIKKTVSFSVHHI